MQQLLLLLFPDVGTLFLSVDEGGALRRGSYVTVHCRRSFAAVPLNQSRFCPSLFSVFHFSVHLRLCSALSLTSPSPLLF